MYMYMYMLYIHVEIVNHNNMNDRAGNTCNSDIGHFTIISCFCRIKGLFGLPLCLNNNNICVTGV